MAVVILKDGRLIPYLNFVFNLVQHFTGQEISCEIKNQTVDEQEVAPTWGKVQLSVYPLSFNFQTT